MRDFLKLKQKLRLLSQNMTKTIKGLEIANFALILAILADMLFPKAAAAGSITPDFSVKEQNQAVAEVAGDAHLERAGDAEPRRVIYVTVTAYSSTPDQTDDSPFITANGSWVHEGTLAANFLPFGTKIKLPDYSGDKTYVVEDRMNQRYTYRADVWMPTREAAKQFGVRKLKMEIY